MTARAIDAPLIDCRTGQAASMDDVVARARPARVIYVGERHEQQGDHDVQHAIAAALLSDDPSLAIGLEMVQWPFQPALDRYVSGAIPEAQMLVEIEWQARWNLDFGLYRPIFELARGARIPLVALNARRELTRAIAREGIDSLGPELRAELPEMVTDDAEHRAMIEAALSGHGSATSGSEGHPAMDPARLERFYLAQLTWDETMGARVAERLVGPEAPRRMVVLAGRMHVERGLGIPRRAARRGAEPFVVIVPLTASELAGAAELCDFGFVVADETAPDSS